RCHQNYENMMPKQVRRNIRIHTIQALNIQLVVSSCCLQSVIIFEINTYEEKIGWPAYTSVPVAMMQNVLAPIANLFVIMPYRR
ncbi:hypothetical protein PMAYCL1PPCAC_15653, partial [Pristionchus mayeri]